MDVHTKAQRSYNMSQIRGRWTLPEKKVHNLLKGLKIKHKMYPKIAGSPDLIIPELKTAVFLHGCFWHGCPRCFIKPATRQKFWTDKIKKNKARDRKSIRKLRADGWKVVVLWEHDIKNGISLSSIS